MCYKRRFCIRNSKNQTNKNLFTLNILLNAKTDQKLITFPSKYYFMWLCCLLCPTLCDFMNYSTPGFPVLHYLPDFAQTHVHWVGDAIWPSNSLSPPSPLALNLSQHQSLFQWLGSSIRWPKYWSFSFSITPSNEYSGLTSFHVTVITLVTSSST